MGMLDRAQILAGDPHIETLEHCPTFAGMPQQAMKTIPMLPGTPGLVNGEQANWKFRTGLTCLPQPKSHVIAICVDIHN